MRHSLKIPLLVLFLSFLYCLGLSAAIPSLDASAQLLPGKYPSQTREHRLYKRTVLSEYRQHYTGLSMILPIQAGAGFLEHAFDSMNTRALVEWAKQTPEYVSLTLGKESVSVTFVSSDPNVPVPWQFIIFFCDELAFKAQSGWTGIYNGSWTHLATQVVIFITMKISMVAAAA
ncbi:MAG: hypothetical protein Q9207_003748 [Kuettlingeria erythrocarpa]